MGRYKRCPNCEKIMLPWWNFCPRCGNDLEYKTIVSPKVAKKREEELMKWKEKTEKKLGL